MRSNLLRAADVRPLLELSGELHAMPADAAARRLHALGRLRALVGGRGALWAQTGDVDGRYRMTAPVTLGLDAIEPGRLAAYFGGAFDFDPCAAPMQAAAAGTVARRRELVDDARWYASRYFNESRGPFGFDDGLYAHVGGPGGGVFGVCFLREPRDRPFAARHAAVLSLFVRHVAPLCLPDAPADRLARLPPRLRTVAERLCAGDSVKQAALVLDLSPHTVAEYAKQLHRALGVSSRGELLAALMG